MIGLLVQLAISWLLLWLFERRDLSVLGFKPTTGRLLNFLLGFLIAAACLTGYSLTTTALSNNHWSLNGDFTIRQFGTSSWWTLKSVLFEELIFRGAILYVLIQKAGIRTACLISAVAFGVYHWFSYGALGNPVQMGYVFISTGLWGFMYALAFAKTKSLYLPTGLHLGWNLLHIVVFSQGPLGPQLLVNDNSGEKLTGLPSTALLLFQVFALPVIVYSYLTRYRKEE